MRFGRTVEDGFLPVYSVDTPEEARALLVESCREGLCRMQCGEFVSNRLDEDQSVERLFDFGHELAALHKRMAKKRKVGA